MKSPNIATSDNTGRLTSLWESHPLLVIMIVAAGLRLVAAIFSKGFGMLDDHFSVIEVAQGWVDGHSDWLNNPDSLRSLVYPGLHYLLFAGLQKIGVFDPQAKMYVVRFIHAGYSLLTVYFGYKLVETLAGARPARLAGLLLAAFWIVPFVSVRNLIEFVCVPPLVAGTYLLARIDSETDGRRPLLAGLLFGIAFVLRFPTGLMAAVTAVLLASGRKWRAAPFFAAGVAVSAGVLQGLSDWIGYGFPFSSLIVFITYNSANAQAYTVGPWHRYVDLLSGILIPPTGLLLIFGFLRTWRRAAYVFWPTLAFLIAHSLYPNKQERFILPVMPFVIMLGVIGWQEFVSGSGFWTRHRKLLRGLWVWFWLVNGVLLAAFTTTYSRKPRCEMLTVLSHKADLTGVVIESDERSGVLPPLFYLGRQVPVVLFPAGRPVDALVQDIDGASARPNYLIMMGEENREARLARLSRVFPEMTFETRIEPSLVDRVLYRLNPRYNVNPPCDIYRVTTR